MTRSPGDRHGSLMTAALRAVWQDTTLPPETAVSPEHLGWLIESGLGPLLYRLWPAEGVTGSPGYPPELRGADLASRALTQNLLSGIERTLGLLNDVGIEPTLLKGIAFATRYYPEPHLRLMRDVDLLVPSNALPGAEGALLEAGFQLPSGAPPSRWADHHHAPPLYHPEMKLWIELHTGLLPPNAEAFGEPPLDLGRIERDQETSDFGCRRVKRLGPEFEIAYLAVGWCRNLATEFARPGLQRPLVDAVYLLKANGNDLDWDRIVAWSRGTLTGASIYILLSYLHRHGAYSDSRQLLPVLRTAQPFVGARSVKLIHGLLDRHLIDDRLPERAGSVHVIGNIFDALIARRPAWRNWLTVPGSVIFPRREERRFQWRYHWDRLLSLFER